MKTKKKKKERNNFAYDDIKDSQNLHNECKAWVLKTDKRH